jgi:hypothetical protein
MLSWLPRQRARMERIEVEDETMIGDFGADAYFEARRREHEASSDAIAKDWGQIALAVARKVSKRVDVAPSIRVAMNAVLISDREAGLARKTRILAGLMPAKGQERVFDPKPKRFRIQFAALRQIADRRS